MKHENKTGGAGLLRYGNFIAGEWQDAVGGEHITLRNPSDGSDLALIARGTKADIDLAVAAARNALSGDWGKLTATERGRVLHRISEEVLKNIDLLTDLESKMSASRSHRRVPMWWRWRVTSNFMALLPTRCMATRCLIRMVLRFCRFMSRMASRGTSFRGTTRCRFWAAALAQRLPWAMQPWSNLLKKPA